MATVLEILQERLRSALQTVGISLDGVPQLAPTEEPRFGDYQSNVAMVLGKTLRENPRKLATSITEALLAHREFSVEVAGPGFINFRISPEFVSEHLVRLALDERLGVQQVKHARTIVIDFSSPNIAKPMHVGHIRSTILGDVLARVARCVGHHVITDNHLGDWGTQFGKVIYGWKHLLNSLNLKADPASELVRVYREADDLAKKNSEVLQECRAELLKLQQGDKENQQIWQQCVDISRQEFAKIYDALDIRFEHQLGESHYNAQLHGVVGKLLDKAVVEFSEGAIVYWDRSLSQDPFILQKSDGGFGYAATDVATLEYRMQHWHPDAIWYVVGAPQSLHFRQLFSLARRLRYGIELEHIAFGSILGEDRKLMRTRSGESVPLRDLLREAVSRAETIVTEKNPQLDQNERAAIGRIVGLGAVKYAELSQHRMSDYVFSWDKLLSLHGNTAPYLQNAYVRSRAIFRKLEVPFEMPASIELRDDLEIVLAKKILHFPDVVPAILDGFKPNVLANYLYELAAQFHGFYELCPVLSAERGRREARLLLCEVFARLLRSGLELLGIQVPEKM
jgi:arginyl-tRNA synthetase